jgi:hypothetical protein
LRASTPSALAGALPTTRPEGGSRQAGSGSPPQPFSVLAEVVNRVLARGGAAAKLQKACQNQQLGCQFVALCAEWRAFNQVSQRRYAVLQPQPPLGGPGTFLPGSRLTAERREGVTVFPPRYETRLRKEMRQQFRPHSTGQAPRRPSPRYGCGGRPALRSPPQQEGRVLLEPVPGIGLPLAGWPRKQFCSVPYPLPLRWAHQ